MSDRFPGSIQIGGTIRRVHLPYLVGCLSDDGASQEYGDKAIDSDCSETELMEYLKEGVLEFCNDQAHNGEFERTEDFCVEHDIAFHRWSDHCCEYDAEIADFRPGMNSCVVRYSDSNANEIVCGKTVRQAMTVLKLGEVDEALQILAAACPAGPEALQPVIFVE